MLAVSDDSGWGWDGDGSSSAIFWENGEGKDSNSVVFFPWFCSFAGIV